MSCSINDIAPFEFSQERLLEYDITLEEVKQAVRDTDPHIVEDELSFKVGVILLSSVFVGPTIFAIKKFTKYPKHLISKCHHHFRRNRIWGGSERGRGPRWVDCKEWWEDAETSGVAFWLYVLCGEGHIERDEDNRWRQI